MIGVREVAGSNPVVPTSQEKAFRLFQRKAFSTQEGASCVTDAIISA